MAVSQTAVSARSVSTSARVAARRAGLSYVSDESPGITRLPSGRGFRYLSPKGTPVTSRRALQRIEKLVIPPAWKDVWICSSPNGHIQAVGRDAKGRKQYIYHPAWRSTRDANKYAQLIAFGKLLPAIRRQVSRDLRAKELTRDKVVATIVCLLENSLIRVGNDQYARQNQSFGLTTLRNRHVKATRTTIRFQFRGKSGVEHSVELQDRRLAAIIRECHELPGQRLFQYLDEAGHRHAIRSSDVNEYLSRVSQAEITAKHFRTWAGTLLMASTLLQAEVTDDPHELKKTVTQAVRAVAVQLGNTLAVCRKCYVHPAVLDAFQSHTLGEYFRGLTQPSGRVGRISLSPVEKALLKLLRKAATTRSRVVCN